MREKTEFLRVIENLEREGARNDRGNGDGKETSAGKVDGKREIGMDRKLKTTRS